jgi:hypothetical protein
MRWRHKIEREEETKMNCQEKKEEHRKRIHKGDRERDDGIREKNRRKGKRES